MEIVVLVVIWLIAMVAANDRDFGFALFLVFASLGGVLWRWRGKLGELTDRLARHETVMSGLSSELKQVAGELRGLKSRLDEAAASGSPSSSSASAPASARTAPEAGVTRSQTAASPVLEPAASAARPTMPVPAAVPAASHPPIPQPQPAAPVKPASPLVSQPVKPTIPGIPAPVVAASGTQAASLPGTSAPLQASHATVTSAPAFRISGSQPVLFRNLASQPEPAERASKAHKLKKSLDLEELVGRNVLPKLGIFLLVIGTVSTIAMQWQRIPAYGKDLMLLAAAGVLLGLGIFLERKERYELFGRVLIGGGWAMLFYTSYALYHVSATRVLPSQMSDLVIMLATAAAMVWHTLRYRSQVVTGIAYLLAFSTVTISEETVFSLMAGAVLALSLVVLIRRMRWYELEVFGILASYLNHFRFLYPILGIEGGHRMFPQFYASTALLIFYWAVFRGSYVFRRIESKHEESVSTLACLLNSFLLLGLMKYQSVHPELAFYALLALGAVELTLSLLPITRRRRLAFLILATLGSTLMIAAIPFRFSGMNTAVLWLAGAEALLISGVLAREVAFRRLGMLAGLLTAGHILIVDVRPWLESILNGTPAARDLTLGVLLIFCAVVIFYDAHLLELRRRDLFREAWDRRLLSAMSYAAGIIAFCALWMTLPSLPVAVGWAALMFVLAFASKRLARTELIVQTTLLAVLAAVRVFAVNLQANAPQEHGARLWTVIAVAAIFYLSARFTEVAGIEVQLRAFFQWTATAMVAALLWVELPVHWVAPAWTLFAIALAVVGRRLRLASLLYQCYALSASAMVAALAFNWPLEQHAGTTTISLRLITVALVAAGFYVLSVLSQPLEEDRRGACRAAFNTGAALLLGGLIWFEAGETWSPVLWTLFATGLLICWRKLNFSEFFWHAHALAAAALANAYVFNMFMETQVHGVSARLITVLSTALLFYFDAWLASTHKVPEWDLRISDLYTWSASLLVTTLMWHELRPIDVAIGWAIFGIVLFEVGLERKLPQLRWQGGIALCASFVRIFFVNLNAVGEPGRLSPRVYSVLPLAMVYLYVYWRTLAREDAFGLSRWKKLAPMLFSSLGVASIAFLIRFEAPAPYVVVFWAALCIVLLAAARWTHQSVFLYQALVLAVCTTARSMLYNLVTPSYFAQVDVRARTLGAVIALFFAALFFAFRLRELAPRDVADDIGVRRLLRSISMRPEQLFFFSAVALLTPLIAVEMKHGEITVGWGVEAVLVFVFALVVGERSFRLCGLGLLLLCVGKLCLDVWNMNTGDRTISMTVLGAVLLLVSFLYNRYRETIRKYL